MVLPTRDQIPSPSAQVSGWRPLVTGIVVSYLANAAWELAQMSLYVTSVPPGWIAALTHCGKAAGGDLLLMGILYLVLVLAIGSWRWPLEPASYRHPATWVLTPAVGALLAVAFELWAVYVDHRWAYGTSMPLIPGLSVGVTPVLQMIVIPLLVLVLLRPREPKRLR